MNNRKHNAKKLRSKAIMMFGLVIGMLMVTSLLPTTTAAINLGISYNSVSGGTKGSGARISLSIYNPNSFSVSVTFKPRIMSLDYLNGGGYVDFKITDGISVSASPGNKNYNIYVQGIHSIYEVKSNFGSHFAMNIGDYKLKSIDYSYRISGTSSTTNGNLGTNNDQFRIRYSANDHTIFSLNFMDTSYKNKVSSAYSKTPMQYYNYMYNGVNLVNDATGQSKDFQDHWGMNFEFLSLDWSPPNGDCGSSLYYYWDSYLDSAFNSHFHQTHGWKLSQTINKNNFGFDIMAGFGDYNNANSGFKGVSLSTYNVFVFGYDGLSTYSFKKIAYKGPLHETLHLFGMDDPDNKANYQMFPYLSGLEQYNGNYIMAYGYPSSYTTMKISRTSYYRTMALRDKFEGRSISIGVDSRYDSTGAAGYEMLPYATTIPNYYDISYNPNEYTDANYKQYGPGGQVESTSSSAYGFTFGLEMKHRIHTFYGNLEIRGFFGYYDTFSSSLQSGRRYLKAYIIQSGSIGSDLGYGGSVIKAQTIIDYNDQSVNTLAYHQITIHDSALSTNYGYQVVIGRGDAWSYDWSLRAYVNGLVIYGDILW